MEMFSILCIFLFAYNVENKLLVNDQINTIEYPSVQECFGGIGQLAQRPFRFHFKRIGRGNCQFLLCYPSQLDENAVVNGLMPEIGYIATPQNDNNVTKECNERMGENWYGIRLRAIWLKPLEMEMSIVEGKILKIDGDEFQLKLNGAKSAIMIRDDKTNYLTPDNDRNNEKEMGKNFHEYFKAALDGAHFKDYPGFWQLPFDILPAPNPLHSSIEIFAFGWERDLGKICDAHKGTEIPNTCQIQAEFLNPSEDDPPFRVDSNDPQNGEIKLPNTWEVDHANGILSSIFISGQIRELSERLGIHFLHNWAEPHPIMAQTVLYIRLRAHFINTHAIYNMTPTDSDDHALTSALSKGPLALNITFNEDDGICQILLNCKPILNVTETAKLPFASIDYIHIKGNMIVHNNSQFHYKPYPSRPVEKPPTSISLKIPMELNASNFLLINFYLPLNATKFDIRLINYNGADKSAKILLHFFANVADGNEQYFLLNNGLQNSQSTLKKPKNLLAHGKEFRWYLDLNVGIYVNNEKIFGPSEINEIYAEESFDDYVQMIGDFHLLNISVDELKPKKFRLESPFQPFQSIILPAPTQFPELKIQFRCENETNKCHRTFASSINPEMPAFEIRISELTLYLLDKNGTIVKERPIEEDDFVGELTVHASEWDYQFIFNQKTIASVDFRDFARPNEFDTIFYNQEANTRELKLTPILEQKQEELAIPFYHKLPKPLEFGGSIKIKFELTGTGQIVIVINLMHDVPHENGKKIGFKVLGIVLDTEKGITVSSSVRRDAKPIEVDLWPTGQFYCEIVFQKEFYEININGSSNATEKNSLHPELPLWAVDYLEVDGKGAMELKEVNISWPPEHPQKRRWGRHNSTNSWKIYGFNEIDFKMGWTGERLGWIRFYFLNRCKDFMEAFKELCDIVLMIELVFHSDGTMTIKSHDFNHLNQKWGPEKKKKFTSNHDPEKNMKFKYNETEQKIYLYLGNNTENLMLEAENGPHDIPFNDIAYLKIDRNFGGLIETKIAYGDQSSSNRKWTKVDGLLRPSDAIVFRGSVENPFGVNAFYLLYGASRATSKAAIRIGHVEVNSVGAQVSNDLGKRCLRNESILSVDDDDDKNFDFEILIGQKHGGSVIVRTNSNDDKSVECNRDGKGQMMDKSFLLYWAIQYISIPNGIQMEAGYPKIVHYYKDESIQSIDGKT